MMHDSITCKSHDNVILFPKLSNYEQRIRRIRERRAEVEERKERTLRRKNLENRTISDRKVPLSAVEEEADTMAVKRMRVCIGFEPDGTPIIRRMSADTETELADKVAKALIESGRILDLEKANSKKTPAFQDYAISWFETYKACKVKPTTASDYQNSMRCHLFPAFGSKPIGEITVADIQAFLNGKSHLARKTIKNILDVARMIFASAQEDKLISENPVISRRLSIPSEKVSRREALKPDALKDIASNLNKLQELDRRLLALLMFTGMRRGEVLGLRWEDIDEKEMTIRVSRNATYPAGQNDALIGTPKTENGYRVIPVIPALFEALKPTRAEGFVIGIGDKPITKMVYVRTWERIERTIDLHGATAHVLRHSLATMLYTVGTQPKAIQQIIGHADISTTMNRYVHGSEAENRKAMDNVQNIYTSNTAQAV